MCASHSRRQRRPRGQRLRAGIAAARPARVRSGGSGADYCEWLRREPP
jgi:hypothetical protein